jgi:hypothetical protein
MESVTLKCLVPDNWSANFDGVPSFRLHLGSRGCLAAVVAAVQYNEVEVAGDKSMRS